MHKAPLTVSISRPYFRLYVGSHVKKWRGNLVPVGGASWLCSVPWCDECLTLACLSAPSFCPDRCLVGKGLLCVAPDVAGDRRSRVSTTVAGGTVRLTRARLCESSTTLL